MTATPAARGAQHGGDALDDDLARAWPRPGNPNRKMARLAPRYGQRYLNPNSTSFAVIARRRGRSLARMASP